jgi:chromosome partitioning protein
MMKMSRGTVYALVNQKGGTGKTQSTENIGIGLANEGKRVLLVDLDPQGSLTISLGYPKTDDIPVTVTDIMSKVLKEEPLEKGEGIIHHKEGVDLLPANISLAGMEVSLVNVMARERILKEYLDSVKSDYDVILIDCNPSLGMLTINAMTAADKLIIPMQAQYLSAKGLEALLQTVSKVKRQMNPGLKIDGILLTMVDGRTNYGKEISELVRNVYGGKIKVYDTEIPHSVRAAEISAAGESIYKHDPKGKVAEAYRNLTKEVLKNAEIARKHSAFEL